MRGICKRTIVEHKEGIYSAFPTFVVHQNHIYIYFRQGRTSNAQVHGLHGVVKRLKIPVSDYLNAHLEPFDQPLSHLGTERTVFAAENELDAIVARLVDDLFALCTRDTIVGSHNNCFVSFSNEPEFCERERVSLKGVEIHAFYGKPVTSRLGHIFTAYGALEKDGLQRPLLLITDTQRWEVLAAMPTMLNGNRLNECSLVEHQGRWFLFIREDDPPFGIWYAGSDDLHRWSPPEKIINSAHAPMALSGDDRLYLSYRWLVKEDSSAVALTRPFEQGEPLVVDRYLGSPYDGGYTDLGIMGNMLNLLYYHGNPGGEPCIRSALIPLSRLNGDGMQ